MPSRSSCQVRPIRVSGCILWTGCYPTDQLPHRIVDFGNWLIAVGWFWRVISATKSNKYSAGIRSVSLYVHQINFRSKVQLKQICHFDIKMWGIWYCLSWRTTVLGLCSTLEDGGSLMTKRWQPLPDLYAKGRFRCFWTRLPWYGGFPFSLLWHDLFHFFFQVFPCDRCFAQC